MHSNSLPRGIKCAACMCKMYSKRLTVATRMFHGLRAVLPARGLRARSRCVAACRRHTPTERARAACSRPRTSLPSQRRPRYFPSQSCRRRLPAHPSPAALVPTGTARERGRERPRWVVATPAKGLFGSYGIFPGLVFIHIWIG
jgi:hypothetical protein